MKTGANLPLISILQINLMNYKRKTELWVGFFLLLGLIMATIMVVSLGKVSDYFKDTYTIDVVFKNASGILKGSEVRLGGARIGKVTSTPSLTMDGNAVSLDITMDKNVRLQKGSTIKTATLNLLGDKYIEITPPPESTDTYLQDGETVYGQNSEDIDKIKDNLSTISDKAIILMNGMQATINDFKRTSQGFAEMSERVNAGVLNDENMKNLAVMMKNLAQASDNVVKTSEELPSVLSDFRDTAKNIKEASLDVKEVVNRIDERVAGLDPAIKQVEPTILAMKQTAESMDKTMKDIRKGDGFLGALIYDKEMKVALQDFIRHLRAQGLLRYKNQEAEDALNDYSKRAQMEGPRRY